MFFTILRMGNTSINPMHTAPEDEQSPKNGIE